MRAPATERRNAVLSGRAGQNQRGPDPMACGSQRLRPTWWHRPLRQ